MPRSVRSRSSVALTLAPAVAILAALWWAGWWGAATLAEREMDAWLAREDAAGRQWTCPDRSVEGFPFALTVRCLRPSFHGEVAGHDADGVVERLEASVGVTHPGTVAATLHGPLTLRARDDAFLVALSWEGLVVTVPLRLGMPTDAAVEATRLAASGSAPAQGEVNLRAARLVGSVAAAETGAADRRFGFTLAGLTFPTLDILPGFDAGPAEAAGSGVLVGATLLSAPTVARLEAWRRAGGALQLGSLRFGQGAFRASATGRLQLDDAHRPSGTLDAELVGFEPLAKRFGIPIAGVQLGGLLASVLGGGKAAAPAERGALRLPLTIADGRLQLGPFPLGAKLSPLY